MNLDKWIPTAGAHISWAKYRKGPVQDGRANRIKRRSEILGLEQVRRVATKFYERKCQ